MKPSKVKESLTHLAQRKRPVFLWGPPGIGKSDIVRSVAADMKIELRDVRLSMLDPVDLRGFPTISGTGKAKSMAWVPPNFLPTKGSGILFLDELNNAPQAVQAAAYQLILDRRLGDYELPPGWAVIGAGNRAGDRAVVHAMSTALRNRFVHIDVEVDTDEWFLWATKNGVSDVTRAFIKFRPGLLHSFDPSSDERAFPTPRSWVFLDDIVVTHSLGADVELELIKGTVGEGAAAEYLSFVRVARDLPTTEQILADPASAPIPESPAAQYALCTMLDKKATPTNLEKLLTYLERLPREFQILFMRSAIQLNNKLAETKVGIAWLIKNKDVLL